MSIFGKIASAIFGKAKASETAVAQSAKPGTAIAPSDLRQESQATPMTRQQVETMIQKLAEQSGHRDYKT